MRRILESPAISWLPSWLMAEMALPMPFWHSLAQRSPGRLSVA